MSDWMPSPTDVQGGPEYWDFLCDCQRLTYYAPGQHLDEQLLMPSRMEKHLETKADFEEHWVMADIYVPACREKLRLPVAHWGTDVHRFMRWAYQGTCPVCKREHIRYGDWVHQDKTFNKSGSMDHHKELAAKLETVFAAARKKGRF